ncbi:hypothetical protein G8V03_09710 [Clostridium botulinum D/C]|uniref:hypothetical protein n=1 Tax=Clostridium botulinum TaxID=1491 RepID=UPI001E2BBE00|nr:hypothetical protein [Clostridium botulinum]MCD3351261.1 hypothetical protein [Clostridium botulinum D/C]MCD3360218.1 hypothetical protein [Clostridium botulinum D/C]MCD3361679.1 hypothetical protein [Clostridium botulinum D/C]MCD3366023.1 hypothetical protein [Clostridium botulinum D/C]
MNNIKQTGATVTLDKERKVIFDLNALCEIEEKYESLDKALEKLSPKNGMPSMKDIRYIFYLGLKNDDEKLTEKKVGTLITLSNIQDVVEVIGNVMTGSLPEPKGEEKNE